MVSASSLSLPVVALGMLGMMMLVKEMKEVKEVKERPILELEARVHLYLPALPSGPGIFWQP